MLNLLVSINISDEVLLLIICLIMISIASFVVFNNIKVKRKEDKEIDSIISNMVKERKEPQVEEDVDDKTKELEDVLEKMQKDLEAKPSDVVETFEREQEEKAIISYTELVKTLKKGNYDEEKTIDILVDEIKEAALNNETKTSTLNNRIKEDKKFKNTDFISPIYGKMEEHLDYPKVCSFKKDEEIDEYLDNFDKKLDDYNLNEYIEEFNSDNNVEINTLENTLDIDPINSEIKKNEEFLSALKEFRQNL